MARLWWTTYPDKYFLKSLSKGGRNEILFTVLGIILIKTLQINFLTFIKISLRYHKNLYIDIKPK